MFDATVLFSDFKIVIVIMLSIRSIGPLTSCTLHLIKFHASAWKFGQPDYQTYALKSGNAGRN